MSSTPTPASTDARVVGVGASAGGLEALQEFLRGIDDAGSITVVVAQHLAPSHPTLIVDLLSRSTPLSINEAIDGSVLVPGTVVIAPPNRDITVDGRVIRLTKPEERTGPSPSIDLLFESLAQHWGAQATAVVLSGTGSDGSHGIRDVHRAGGVTMVQDPSTAQFDGMPTAAIATANIDLVAEAGELGRRLTTLIHANDETFGDSIPEAHLDTISAILDALRESPGMDFGRYKESTLRRQIQRRMAIRGVPDSASYADIIAGDPEESQALASSLLVTVTSFFRDAEAFSALAATLKSYVSNRDPAEMLRIWVPGCATGEEVYSIAMLVAEVLVHPAHLQRRVKIFGTDLDESSLAFARLGTYSTSAVQHIPEQLRERYLEPRADHWRVSEQLRECTVFARHDVGSDPPFPRIDLISCRNTLIYFGAALQRQVFRAFAFSLRPGGLLFLGQAENVDRSTRGFATLNADWRIFERTREAAASIDAHTPTIRPRPEVESLIALPEPIVSESKASRDFALLEAVVRISGQSSLVLDDEHQLVHVVGDVSRYCVVPEGHVSMTGIAFVRDDLKDEARTLFLLARADQESVLGHPITLSGSTDVVQLRATPIEIEGTRFTILTFLPQESETDGAIRGEQRDESTNREIARLERELVATQDSLRRSLSDLQASNEELEASSEELQAAAEELQASNEELQASNEELQATNEELGTLNQELRLRTTELEQLNVDLENIQSSLSQGMVIVDHDLCVVRFTPLAVRVFALLNTDIGQPLLNVPTTMPLPNFAEYLSAVAHGKSRRSLQASGENQSYLIQVLPYLTQEGEHIGVIITLTDVTEMVELRRSIETALSALQDKSILLTQQAAYDETTGLLNRSYFASALEQEITRAARGHASFAVAWIDLDRFKEVNDRFGHAAGDVAIKVVGQRIQGAVRAADVVGRLGGDEFGVIITGYQHLAELDIVLDRLSRALTEPISVGDSEVRIGGSIGVALFPDDEASTEGLLRAADAAMYTVKSEQSGRYRYFSRSMDEDAERRHALREEISRAIQNADFELHYHPIENAQSGQPWGMEALVRWRRDGDLVPAAEFIPFCNESRQIRPLGMLILRLLRADLETIQAAGYADLMVAVNMSAHQLEDPALVELLETWPSPGGLTMMIVEILESSLLPEHRLAMRTLNALVRLGAEVSIDDYGAGYSNFSTLESLSPHYIKLDSSFLSEARPLDARTAVIDSAVSIGHAFGAQIIAEGVETPDQKEFVVDAGVDLIQGFLVCPPLPLDDLLVWLNTHYQR